MQDKDLRELERQWKLSGSYEDRFAYRNALIRAGLAADAGIEIGDICLIEEKESPWIRGAWEGEILKIYEKGDAYVRPVNYEQPYRVKPSAHYYNAGLYLTHSDLKRVTKPVLPERYETLADVRRECREQDERNEKIRKEAEESQKGSA